MLARIMIVVAIYLFAAVWVWCYTQDEMSKVRAKVFMNADQWQSSSVYLDPGRRER